MTLTLLGNTKLRLAIKRNLVTFPSQIRPLMKRPAADMQQRIVQLYFVRGWSARNISARYGLREAKVHKILADWKIRAIESAYIQEIEPALLEALIPETTCFGVTGDHRGESVIESSEVFRQPGATAITGSGVQWTSDLLPTTLWPSRSKTLVDGDTSATS